ncbi:MAG: tetratricopeptide repeat protein [Minwuia sp.]|uniref:tetratricopeptide repeat protein n=1 Tax=Minwuia sp. TaxID=2493630 RepID=UPI003A8C7CB0
MLRFPRVLLAVLLLLTVAPMAFAAIDERVNIRFGDHEGYSRAVFDWGADVGFKIEEGNGSVSIHFDRPADFDLSHYRARAPRAMTGVEVSDDGKTITFTAPSGQVLKQFRLGTRVVVDIARGAGKPDAPAPAKMASPEPARMAQPESAREEASRRPKPHPAASAAKAAPRPQPEPAKQAPKAVAKAAPAPAPEPQPEAPAETPAAETEAPAVPSDRVRVPVIVERRPDRTILRFAWPEKTSAVALHRGEHIWLAFGVEGEPDFGAQSDQDLGPVLTVFREPAQKGTLVRIDVVSGAALDVIADDNEWIIDIGGGRGRAEKTVEFESQADAQDGPRIYAPVAAPSDPIIVDDPMIGDRIALVPLMEPGHGVRPARAFVKLDIPETPQGVAIRFKTLDLQVDADPDGLAISGTRTLNLSAEAKDPGADSGLPPALGGAIRPSERSMMDLAAWRGSGNIVDDRHSLMVRISNAPPAARNAERRAYVRFLVANGLAAEALGVMARIEEEDPRADLDPVYRATRGVANLLAGRFDDANVDLTHPSLMEAGDLSLFRGILAERRRDFIEARRQFTHGWSRLNDLPEDMRPRFRIALAQTALHLHDFGTAEEQVGKLLQYAGSASRHEDAQLIAAQINDRTGDVEEAESLYATLAESIHRDIRARARFLETNLLLKEDRINLSDAVERMERLRFTWRGDIFEFDLLKRLGELYIDSGRYRDGMMVMRETVDRFPNLPEAQRLASQMNNVFASLFEGRHAEEMSPITAMGLYYDFRELTPEGGRGDRMIRRLADRLAAVELLDEAAKLLEHQVRHRLKGDERARVGTRLAVLYLLDGKPREAIDALRSSRNLSMPEELQRERRLLEARGTTELGQYDRALLLLNGLSGDDVNDVRTEILWRARKWQQAATSLSDRLVEIRSSRGPLAREARQDILRFAIASSLAGDRQALERLRDDFSSRMDGQPEWPAFQIVTAEDQRDSAEFRNLAAEIAQVDRFEAFMSSYRERLRKQPLSAIN